MPIYEYVCTTCRNRFERMRSMETSREDVACPGCGTQAPRALSMFAAFSRVSGSELEAIAGGGGGCACGAGGACGCSAGMGF